MKPVRPETIETLEGVNRSFYERSARSFSATRSAPWSGWARLLGRFDRPLSVLDLGCGNGRFYAALSERGLAGDYLGVDASAALVDIARARHTAARFVVADATDFDSAGFDLVVAFGLLHHLAGRERRRQFVANLRGPMIAVAFWRFAGIARFEDKRLPWSTVGIDPDDVEPGDYLLSFQDERRYCHHASDEEIAEMLAGRRVVDRYLADGDLNLYAVAEEARGR